MMQNFSFEFTVWLFGFAMIGLADKVPQRLAGVVGVVAVNGGLEPVVHQLLQDVSRHAGAENEKVAAHQALVDGQPGRAGLIPDGHGQRKRRHCRRFRFTGTENRRDSGAAG